MLPRIILLYIVPERRLEKITKFEPFERGAASLVKRSSRNNICRRAFLESLMWHIEHGYPVTAEVLA